MQSFKKPSRRAAVIVGAAGIAVLGAVGAGATAFADTTPTPGASQTAAPSGAPTHGPGAGGPAAHKHTPHIGGTVQSVSGSTVVVKDPDGFTRTIQLADDVTVTKDGSSSSVTAITKGEHVDATGSVDADGTTLDATAVSVGKPTPPAGGPGGKGGPGAKGGPHGAPRTEGAPTPPEGGASAAPTPPEGGPSAAPTPSSGS